MRRAAGTTLLLGGLLAVAGLAVAALLGLHPFAPAWAFAACAAGLAGLALRNPVEEAGEGPDSDPGPSEGGGTGAGDAGGHGSEADAGEGGDSGGPD
ncbi:hypothetical protein [Paracraurococcus lichenis]|uniref:Uncharacterized protein n=1 Tax=Paracraurococcus lichenis TaxID=3064888 RepID=A0ABT9DX33_9PROT|nr:hypothetical protein [Paracraurococcus sp. LOR1-02]MDO9708460.1 hypothetical protein [Paracraurococcus sp. LOR1-02]